MALSQEDRKQLLSWVKNRRESRIIRFLEKKNPEDLGPQENMLLGRSYVTVAIEENDRNKCEKGLNILRSLHNRFSLTYEYNQSLAQAYNFLGYYSIALLFYKIAYKLIYQETERQYLEEIIKLCEANIKAPTFSNPFENRVERTWVEFEKREQEFRNILDEDTDSERLKELKQKFQAVLKIAFTDIDFHIEKKDGRFQLMLWRIGYPLTQYQLMYFKTQAPESVLRNWDISVGSVYYSKDFKEYNKKSFKESKIWIEKEQDKIFHISFYCPSLLKQKEKDSSQVIKIDALTFLSESTNSVIIDKFILLNKILEEPINKPYLLLPDFSNYLKEQGVNLNEKIAELLNEEVQYSNSSIKASTDIQFLSDIQTGKTKCLKLLLEPEKEINLQLTLLEGEGVTAGWFFYSVDVLADSGDETKRNQFREDLKNFLLEKAGSDTFEIIGEANGTKYDYLQVICWNSTKVFGVATDFFRDSVVKYAAFKTLRPGASEKILKYGS